MFSVPVCSLESKRAREGRDCAARVGKDMGRIGTAMLVIALALPAWATSDDDPRKALRVAQSLVEWGDCEEALPWIDRALEQDPALCRAHFYRATCLMQDPELTAGRQVRTAVAAFEDCAGPEDAEDLAALRAQVPAPRDRRSPEDGVTDRDEGERSREEREVRRPERREDRDEVRQPRERSTRTRQGRGYWDREDAPRDDRSESREERAREERERRDREEREEDRLTEIVIEDDEEWEDPYLDD